MVISNKVKTKLPVLADLIVGLLGQFEFGRGVDEARVSDDDQRLCKISLPQAKK